METINLKKIEAVLLIKALELLTAQFRTTIPGDNSLSQKNVNRQEMYFNFIEGLHAKVYDLIETEFQNAHGNTLNSFLADLEVDELKAYEQKYNINDD